MQTQKATDNLDLPHPFKEDGEGVGVCECGRPQSDELHQRQARETASEHSTLERQTGS